MVSDVTEVAGNFDPDDPNSVPSAIALPLLDLWIIALLAFLLCSTGFAIGRRLFAEDGPRMRDRVQDETDSRAR
jgi:hypothetical protein